MATRPVDSSTPVHRSAGPGPAPATAADAGAVNRAASPVIGGAGSTASGVLDRARGLLNHDMKEAMGWVRRDVAIRFGDQVNVIGKEDS